MYSEAGDADDLGIDKSIHLVTNVSPLSSRLS